MQGNANGVEEMTPRKNEYQAYVEYCVSNGIDVLSEVDYFEELHERAMASYYEGNDFR